jgi:hypothetical protein
MYLHFYCGTFFVYFRRDSQAKFSDDWFAKIHPYGWNKVKNPKKRFSSKDFKPAQVPQVPSNSVKKYFSHLYFTFKIEFRFSTEISTKTLSDIPKHQILSFCVFNH